MENRIREHEWQFMIKLIARLEWCTTSDEFFSTLYEQLRTLIPYYKGVAFLTDRKDSQGILSSSYSTKSPDGITDHSFFTKGKYPAWSEYIMDSESAVFKQSNIIEPGKWEKTRVYREVWKPQNIYWGLMISLVCNDVPLAVVGFFRSRDQQDFSDREMFILRNLIKPLEAILFRILKKNEGKAVSSDYGLIAAAEKYGLTKRENEIVMAVSEGMSDKEICEKLCIAQTTLNKHISNIYAKTNTHSRLGLIMLFK